MSAGSKLPTSGYMLQVCNKCHRYTDILKTYFLFKERRTFLKAKMNFVTSSRSNTIDHKDDVRPELRTKRN